MCGTTAPEVATKNQNTQSSSTPGSAMVPPREGGLRASPACVHAGKAIHCVGWRSRACAAAHTLCTHQLLRIPDLNTCFSPGAPCPRRTTFRRLEWEVGLPGGTAGAGLLSTHAEAAGSTLSGSDTATLPGPSLLRAGGRGEVAEDAVLAGDSLANGGVGDARLAALPVKDLHRERRESALGTGQGGRLDRGRKLARRGAPEESAAPSHGSHEG